MNKAYITGILFRNAIDSVDAAHKANDDGSVDAEVAAHDEAAAPA